MNTGRRSSHTLVCIVLSLGLMLQQAGAVTLLRTSAQMQSEPKFVPAGTDGRPAVAGLCIDIFRAIEKLDAGLAFSGDQEWNPPARLDASLESGLLDVMCGMVQTPRRNERLAVLRPSLFSLRYVLLARAGDDAVVARWSDVTALPGRPVVLSLLGTGPSRQLRDVPGLAVDAGSDSVQHNLDKLVVGRGRFFYYRLPAANPTIHRYCQSGKIKVLPAVMREEPVYMMLGRHVPPAIGRRIEAALRRMKTDGELDLLMKKWQVAGPAGAPC